jgi:hypothetical protein
MKEENKQHKNKKEEANNFFTRLISILKINTRKGSHPYDTVYGRE